VQLVVRIIDVVRAAYMVYQGIKNKSLAMVLGGVASLAGGAGKLAGSLGASTATIDAIKGFADGASKLSMAYNAVANKDLGAAMGLLGGMPGVQGTALATATGYGQQLMGMRDAVRSGDALAFVGGGLALAGTYNGKDTELSQQLGKVQDAVTGARALREIDRGNVDAAQSLTMGMHAAEAASNKSDTILAQRREMQAQEAAKAEQAKAAAANKEVVDKADQPMTHKKLLKPKPAKRPKLQTKTKKPAAPRSRSVTATS
jgi:hypothetical protein